MPTLPLTPPVTVQVTNGTACWTATYGTPQKNVAGEFKAKAD